jgi:sRNA-binding carbon storage regulator CsrA
MLVLSRKKDERIIIKHEGETLEITVTAFRLMNGVEPRVKLGFTGPMSFLIVRDDAHGGEE